MDPISAFAIFLIGSGLGAFIYEAYQIIICSACGG